MQIIPALQSNDIEVKAKEEHGDFSVFLFLIYVMKKFKLKIVFSVQSNLDKSIDKSSE